MYYLIKKVPQSWIKKGSLMTDQKKVPKSKIKEGSSTTDQKRFLFTRF